MAVDVRVQSAPFDLGAEISDFAAAATGAGAIVSFTGLVRDLPDQSLAHMEIEHYAGMTEKALGAIAAEAQARWPLIRVLIIHRYGKLVPSDQIMMVATASPHRKAAFESADFLMDYLKSRAPFWKKEARHDGRADWVEAKDEDEAALAQWVKS